MSDTDTGVIYRPENCEGQEFSAYNVATWGMLTGQEVRHEEYGIGVVQRSNDMSREAWVKFDILHVVGLDEIELIAEDGGVRSVDPGTEQ